MRWKSGVVFQLGLFLICLFTSGRAQENTRSGLEPLLCSALLVETTQTSKQMFREDITNRGLVAVKLALENTTIDRTYEIKRVHIVLRTEFDREVVSLEEQRAYDRLMMKISGGPAFAEYGIARAISEGSRKKKLRGTVLAQALEETLNLEPNQKIEGVVFFERPEDVKTFKHSSLLIQEVIDRSTGQRFPLRVTLALKE